MKLKLGLISAIATAFIVSGCNGIGSLGSSSFSSSQKQEFIEILNEDRYSSICDLGPMIEQYKQTKDDKVLSKLLVRYTQNLANSCIDIDSFQAAVRAKAAKGINTHYEIYEQSVSSSDIMAKLKKGESIENILAPYVPQIPQFQALIDAYNSTADLKTKYKIKLNIEKTKLLKPDGWDTYILINVPEYKFRFFENGQKTLEFKVVVGKPTWQTPIFSSMLKYITVHPTWNVPDNIARKEIIPAIIRDKSYLKRHNMVVKRDYGLDSPEVS